MIQQSVQAAARLAIMVVVAVILMPMYSGNAMAAGPGSETGVEQMDGRVSLAEYTDEGREVILTDFTGTSSDEVRAFLNSLRDRGVSFDVGVRNDGPVDKRGERIVFNSRYGGYDMVIMKGDWQKEFVYKLKYWKLRKNKDPDQISYWDGKGLEPKKKIRKPETSKRISKSESIEAPKNSVPKMDIPKIELDFSGEGNKKLGKRGKKEVQAQLLEMKAHIKQEVASRMKSGNRLTGEPWDRYISVLKAINSIAKDKNLHKKSYLEVQRGIEGVNKVIIAFLSTVNEWWTKRT